MNYYYKYCFILYRNFISYDGCSVFLTLVVRKNGTSFLEAIYAALISGHNC
jgi:hypothetical protein